jgi:hypothetical protein
MLAFVHIHKTAGTTINEILARSYGMRHCYLNPVSGKPTLSAEDYRRVQKLCPRLVSIAGHSICAHSDLDSVRPDVRYYTFLREPLVRCASHYQYQVQQQGKHYSFEEWIEKPIKRNPQTTRIAGSGGTVEDAIRLLERRFIFVGLLEHFDESLVLLRHYAADSRLDIWYRRRLVARDDTIKNRLLSDPATRSRMVDANRLDLALYEYASKELYPAFKRRYSGLLNQDVADFKRANESHSRLGPRLNLLANHYVSRQLLDLKKAISYYR